MNSIAIDIGVINFPFADRFLNHLVELRIQDHLPDMLLILSYTPCLSVGAKKLDENDLLKPLRFFTDQGIFLYKSTRGGGLTYYWPEQLVCYPIIKLQGGEQNIPQFMYHLEEMGLRTLADLGVVAARKREKTAQIGLWVGDEKIVSTGIRVTRWVTSYGLAMNLGGDLEPSRYIRPCGLHNVKLTSISEQTGVQPHRNDAKRLIKSHFQDIFCRKLDSSDGDYPYRDVLRQAGMADVINLENLCNLN